MFSRIIDKYNWDEIKNKIYNKTNKDVEHALKTRSRNLDDFMALISPAAINYLEQMAVLSNKLTLKRFGKTIQMYLPLYLSNECSNHCVYCGFSHNNSIDRVVLNNKQILKETNIIKSYGYEHILLVSGESNRKVGIDYFKNVIELIKNDFSLISMEVQPLEENEYKDLIDLGLNTVYIYQETYNRTNYKKYHLKGKKSNFDYRLETPDRLGRAGIHKIGLGVLIGLEDWRTDTFFTALHLKYLEKKYWKSKYSISFPRLRPHQGNFEPNSIMTDKELVQLICAYRIFNEELDLSMSVRESKIFRDNIVKLGITSISAGSKTEPGGYSSDINALEQFEVHDNRTPSQIVEMIKLQGYEAVWKDWNNYMQ